MVNIPDIVPCMLDAGQERGGIGFVFAVIENEPGLTVDIVLQPVNQDIECSLGSEYQHGVTCDNGWRDLPVEDLKTRQQFTKGIEVNDAQLIAVHHGDNQQASSF